MLEAASNKTSRNETSDFYGKKLLARKISRSFNYATSNLAWQASAFIALLLFLFSFNVKSKSFSGASLTPAIIYAVSAIYAFFIRKKVKADILAGRETSRLTRILGYPMIPLVFTGNIFVSIAGFMVVKRKKTIEYQLIAYSLLTLMAVSAISAINLLKPTVSEKFQFGMILFCGMIILNIIFIPITDRFVHRGKVDKKLLPVALLAIAQIGYGNAFAFLYGLILLSKMKQHQRGGESIEWINIVYRLFRNYMAVIGMLIVVLLITISLVSPLTFQESLAMENNYGTIMKTPSAEFPFGTDNYGRCVFTRIIFGAKISLVVGVVATIIPIIFGGLLGALAAYYGKSLDNVIMRFLDILYAVPGILLAIAIIAAFGTSTTNLIIALSVGNIPVYARTVRATVLSVSKLEFVEAARASGGRNLYIIAKHIIPNSLAPVIVRSTIGIGAAVLSTSALSFLGLGVEPHVPEWGNILKAGSGYLETNPYIAIFPGLAIILIVLAFNFFGDGLRDALDPRLK